MDGPVLDLRDHPFTWPGSRLMVMALPDRDGLWIATAEYERPAEDCELLRGLRTFVGGNPDPVHFAYPDAIRFVSGSTLAFANDDVVSMSIPAQGARVLLDVARAPALWSTGGRAETALPNRVTEWTIQGAPIGQIVTGPSGRSVEIQVGPSHSGARILLGATRADGRANSYDTVEPHAEVVERSRRLWVKWFKRRPPVRDDLVAMADLAWWVLGANQIRLPQDPSRLLVAPSKLGYVAAWQWDSYFIAAGLRHGHPELAWDQVAFFLDQQLEDGLIPDVVSDIGSVASVRDLPLAEISPADGQALDVPITKPPLTAWAAWMVHQALGDPSRLAWALPRIQAAQQWWTTSSDLNGDGLSEYQHRFSSGLDDSPLFDHGTPVESPDLNSYLVVQDDRMARMAGVLGFRDDAAMFAGRARARANRLVALRWDRRRRRFRAMLGTRELRTSTPFQLMPLITGRLPANVIRDLVESVRDPRRFWTNWPVPTVAVDDPAFNPDRMWRGPVWLNVNCLLIEGLAVSGQTVVARELAERTLEMVVQGGGMHEHWNPLTGARPPTATSCFSWSAALFIDLAVYATRGFDEQWFVPPLALPTQISPRPARAPSRQ